MAIGQNEAKKMGFLERRKKGLIGKSYPDMPYTPGAFYPNRKQDFVQHLRIKKDGQGLYVDGSKKHFKTEAELKNFYSNKNIDTKNMKLKFHKRY